MKVAEEFQHARQRMGVVARDELRQEGEEEDRKLRIEDVDQKSPHDDPNSRGAVLARLDRQCAMLSACRQAM